MKPIKFTHLGQLFCGIEFRGKERDFYNKHTFTKWESYVLPIKYNNIIYTYVYIQKTEKNVYHKQVLMPKIY